MECVTPRCGCLAPAGGSVYDLLDRRGRPVPLGAVTPIRSGGDRADDRAGQRRPGRGQGREGAQGRSGEGEEGGNSTLVSVVFGPGQVDGRQVQVRLEQAAKTVRPS